MSDRGPSRYLFCYHLPSKQALPVTGWNPHWSKGSVVGEAVTLTPVALSCSTCASLPRGSACGRGQPAQSTLAVFSLPFSKLPIPSRHQKTVLSLARPPPPTPQGSPGLPQTQPATRCALATVRAAAPLVSSPCPPLSPKGSVGVSSACCWLSQMFVLFRVGFQLALSLYPNESWLHMVHFLSNLNAELCF